MKKILIFGGTFNPIHNGHIKIALTAEEEYGFHEVYFVPSGCDNRKIDDLASPEHRKIMCELALAYYKNFQLCDYEMNQNYFSYTINTIKWFESRHPDAQLGLLLGSDNFMTFSNWYEARTIAQKVEIIVAPRDENTKVINDTIQKLAQNGAVCRILHVPPILISSTLVRNYVKNGKNYDLLVPKQVSEFIRENELYH